MAQIVLDTFTDTPGTSLGSHTPNVGTVASASGLAIAASGTAIHQTGTTGQAFYTEHATGWDFTASLDYVLVVDHTTNPSGFNHNFVFATTTGNTAQQTLVDLFSGTTANNWTIQLIHRIAAGDYTSGTPVAISAMAAGVYTATVTSVQTGFVSGSETFTWTLQFVRASDGFHLKPDGTWQSGAIDCISWNYDDSNAVSAHASPIGAAPGGPGIFAFDFVDQVNYDNLSISTGGGAATAYTFTGPTSGLVNVASTNFTVTPDGTTSDTVTPHTTGSGSFTPATVTFDGTSAAKTFTYTPTSASGSPHTLSVTNSGSLTNPANLSYAVLPGAVAITAPVANQWKRGGGSPVNFTVSGTYTGSPTTIEASTDGATWATLDAAPSAGSYTGTVSLAASESDYTISVRFSNATSVTAGVAGIANLYYAISYGGQSNESGRFTNNQTARTLTGSGPHKQKTATGYSNLADPTNTEGVSAGSYAVQEINVLSVLLGRRIGVVNFAVGATTIANWQKGGGGGGYYEALAAAETAVGGCTICHWGPCETDAHNSTSQASYHAGIVSLIASRAADFPSCKNVWRTLQPIAAYATQGDQDAINAAILAAAGATHGAATGDVSGLYLSDVRGVDTSPDGLHWLTDQQAGTVGGLMAAADYKALNPAGGSGPVPMIGSPLIRSLQ